MVHIFVFHDTSDARNALSTMWVNIVKFPDGKLGIPFFLPKDLKNGDGRVESYYRAFNDGEMVEMDDYVFSGLPVVKWP